jgi:hypothetical protein
VRDILGCVCATLSHVFRCSHRSGLNRAKGNGERENDREQRFHSTLLFVSDSSYAPNRLASRGSSLVFRCVLNRSWARQDSNLGPRDYESPALTAELQAHSHI